MKWLKIGIKIAKRDMKCLRYADTILMAGNKEFLWNLLKKNKRTLSLGSKVHRSECLLLTMRNLYRY